MAFDPQCYELAKAFMSDGADNVAVSELAQLIQDTIEDHLNYGSVVSVKSYARDARSIPPQAEKEVSK